MQIELEKIKTKKRIRKDNLDIAPLAESMQRIGLITPITIDQNSTLIAGQRRLEVAKSLGWETITANVIQIENNEQAKAILFEMEIEENIQRKQFCDEDLLKAKNHLNKLQNPNWFTRLVTKIKFFFKNIFKRNKID